MLLLSILQYFWPALSYHMAEDLCYVYFSSGRLRQVSLYALISSIFSTCFPTIFTTVVNEWPHWNGYYYKTVFNKIYPNTHIPGWIQCNGMGYTWVKEDEAHLVRHEIRWAKIWYVFWNKQIPLYAIFEIWNTNGISTKNSIPHFLQWGIMNMVHNGILKNK